jgi:crotonobetainyl-CoA:carnitine CoA-transferase CaiB-like acyl-CoA transferase
MHDKTHFASKGAATTAPKPLRRLKIVEQYGAGSTDLSRVAVAFAGKQAAVYGAEVVRIEPAQGDPIRGWPPHCDGRSLLFDFLNQGKIEQTESWQASDDMILLTDDPAATAAWPTHRVVRLHTGGGANGLGVATELTTQARAGLLDIFAGADRRPQPLPGHQLAYSAGMAAFAALVAGCLEERGGTACQPVEVSVLDIALWVNWKHYLAAITGDKAAGLARAEEWTTLRCRDGYVALTFQDKDMASLAILTGNSFFDSPEVSTRPQRKKRANEINSAIEAWTKALTREEIVREAQRLRVPVGAVLNMSELAEDAQMQARQFFRVGAKARFPQTPLMWNGIRPCADASVPR